MLSCVCGHHFLLAAPIPIPRASVSRMNGWLSPCWELEAVVDAGLQRYSVVQRNLVPSLSEALCKKGKILDKAPVIAYHPQKLLHTLQRYRGQATWRSSLSLRGLG